MKKKHEKRTKQTLSILIMYFPLQLMAQSQKSTDLSTV